MMFYVYEWFIKDTGEIFYVGKGIHKRYLVRNRNSIFNSYLANYDCDVRIIKYFENEEESFEYEEQRINELKKQGLAKANLRYGGNGGVASVWTEEMRHRMSVNNPMKAEEQRERMRLFNPMKNPETAAKMGQKHAKIVIYQNKEWYIKDLAPILGVSVPSLQQYAKKGYTSKGELCYYKVDGKPTTPPPINKTKKPVQIDNQIFETVSAAAKFLGVAQGTLSSFLLKGGTSYRNHKVFYVNQQPSLGNEQNSTQEGSTTNE